MSVAEVDGRRIGDDPDRPVTRKLTEAFHALVRHEGQAVW
jgi:hypothetical protein